MNRIDLIIVPAGGPVHAAQRRHYLDHAAPVWHALPPERRGDCLCINGLADHARKLGIEPLTFPNAPSMLRRMKGRRRLCLVVGHQDPKFTDQLCRPNAILMHGVGFCFDEKRNHPSYPGTNKNREFTKLMLATNERIAEIERAANPHVRVEVVGCPKLDQWAGQAKRKAGKKPVIAAAWHWDCRVTEETRTAFYEYRQALRELARHYTVLGHGHPHIIDQLAPAYEADGIEVIRSLSDVFNRADLMIADATSAMYEFAALGRPVVVCNKSDYKPIDYGGMFHLRANLGVQCDRPDDLERAVKTAIKDPRAIQRARREVVKQCYAYTDGRCAERAAQAIAETLDTLGDTETVVSPATMATLRRSRRERHNRRLRRI